jgi:thioredoxin reductase
LNNKTFVDIVIIGGSFAGLSAALGLGRSLRSVLVFDESLSANRKAARAHNFITHDGEAPNHILAKAKKELANYPSVRFYEGRARRGTMNDSGFEIQSETGDSFQAKKLLFATGITDLFPPIEGIADCWGKSYLHCPYCHGYEVRKEPTGVWGNGDSGFDLARHIHHWAKDLKLFTNGPASLSLEQVRKLRDHHIDIVEEPIQAVVHTGGQMEHVVFQNGRRMVLSVLFGRAGFRQTCELLGQLGCKYNEQGYVHIDECQRTFIPGIFAAGDNVTSFRTISGAVASGTRAGAYINKDLIDDSF